jgi:glucose-6-phosphate 1-dehydrogenase
VQQIGAHGLHHAACGWTKILIEKPFGTDLHSARQLNAALLQFFQEEQIYRIDHFLGKETVQNLLAFRFANGLFEELWNNTYIDHFQVTMAETLGVDERVQFYDATGATRDVVQNHLLQMIAVTMMEEPASLSPEDIRFSRSTLLNALSCVRRTDGALEAVFGQYQAGLIDGHEVEGYLDHAGVPERSRTETAVALKLQLDTPRWRGVPIYVRTGKRFARDVLEISVQFKDPKNSMFRAVQYGPDPNVLTFRFQPNEGIVLRLFVKKPGHGIELDMVPMQFCYRNTYQMGLVEAYERLIHDAAVSDATLFPRADGIEATWRVVDEVLHAKQSVIPDGYTAGSWGPASFDTLIAQDGRSWIEPSVDVCAI